MTESAGKPLVDVIERLRAQIESAAAVPPDAPPVTLPAAEGHGQALDAQISVTVSGGSVTDLEIGPRAMRVPATELARAITDAVNEAIEQYTQAAARASADEAMPFGAQAAVLRELQIDAVAGLQTYMQGLFETVSRVNADSRVQR